MHGDSTGEKRQSLFSENTCSCNLNAATSIYDPNAHFFAARVQRVRVVLGDQQQARAVAGLQVEVLAYVRVLPTDAAQTMKARLDARVQRPPVLAVWRGVFAMQRETRKCARRGQRSK